MNIKKDITILRSWFFMIIVISFSLFLLSCKPTRYVPDNKYLLSKNRILNCPREVNQEDISLLLKQKPNRKILFVFRFHLGVYNIGNSFAKKDSKKGLWHWMKNVIGEEPVFIIDQKTLKSKDQIVRYLYNQGYFNATVRDSIEKRGSKRAIQYYIIDAGTPYKITEIKYSIQDSIISSIIYKDTINAVIKSKERYQKDLLDLERIRIASVLKNNGFYGFPKELITYRVDSSFMKHEMHLEIAVNNVISVFDSVQNKLIPNKLERYYVRNTYVNTDYLPLQKDSVTYDTLFHKKYIFLYKDKFRYNPRTLSQSIFIRNGELFNSERSDLTYKKLSDLSSFRFINISYLENKNPTLIQPGNLKPLDCNILLTPVEKQLYQVEVNTTNTKDNLGMEGSLIYQHLNLFKGFEQLNIRIKGALEFQYTNVPQESKNDRNFNPFNTYEYGGEISLKVPKFLIPVRQERFPKNMFPKTIFSAGFNYQFRSDYNRIISNITLGYQWKEGRFKTHLFNPVEFNIVQITKDSAFTQRLLAYGNLNTISSFQSHLIPAAKYTFIFNNQSLTANSQYVYFRGSLEWAGNIFKGLSSKLNFDKKPDGSYTLFDVRYSQYIRPDLDFRYYKTINKTSSIATRFAAGVGFAYGNDESMPFEKAFSMGGPNSIRAWRPMSLGLGNYNDTTLTTKIGDMSLETNIEYRYNLYKLLKGALFLDAGNIFLIKKDSTRAGANFDLSNLYKQMALGGGIGFRFDFSFFIVRVDLATKIYNPAKLEGNRWAINEFKPKHLIFNFGIGYPF